MKQYYEKRVSSRSNVTYSHILKVEHYLVCLSFEYLSSPQIPTIGVEIMTTVAYKERTDIYFCKGNSEIQMHTKLLKWSFPLCLPQ